jgi:hypothetical protein
MESTCSCNYCNYERWFATATLRREFGAHVCNADWSAAEQCLEKMQGCYEQQESPETAEVIIECCALMAISFNVSRETEAAKREAKRALAVAHSYPECTSITILVSSLRDIATQLQLVPEQRKLSAEQKKSLLQEKTNKWWERAAKIASTPEDVQLTESLHHAAQRRLIDNLVTDCLELCREHIAEGAFNEARQRLEWGLEQDSQLVPPNLPRRVALLTLLSAAQLQHGLGFIDLAVTSSDAAISICYHLFDGRAAVCDAGFAVALWQYGRVQVEKGDRLTFESDWEQARCYGNAADSLLLAADMFEGLNNGQEQRQNCLKERLYALTQLISVAEKLENPPAVEHHRHVADFVQSQLGQPSLIIASTNSPASPKKTLWRWADLYSGYTTSGDMHFACALYRSAQKAKTRIQKPKTKREARAAIKKYGEAIDKCWFARVMFLQAGPKGAQYAIDCSDLFADLLRCMAYIDRALLNDQIANRRWALVLQSARDATRIKAAMKSQPADPNATPEPKPTED